LPGGLRRILYNQDMVMPLMRRFEHDPPDFIYERASLYATAGVSLARELHVPLLVELNAPLALEQSVYRATGLGELAIRTERYTLLEADAVLTVSTALREHAMSLGVASERVHVVPNGVDALLFQPCLPDAAVRQRWGLDGGPVLGYVGGLRRWHGVEALPPLLEQLGQRYRDLRLVIVGNGPLRGELEALTAACDRLLADSVLRQRLGQAGAREIHSRYTWDHNAARVTELACSLMAARGGDR
jgi:glycosyltransferase involved in cell wall biosynthesis